MHWLDRQLTVELDGNVNVLFECKAKSKSQQPSNCDLKMGRQLLYNIHVHNYYRVI